MLIIEDPTMTVECRTAIKEIFLYFNVCPSVKLESFSYPLLLYIPYLHL
jgi:hypothetical protein